jgi:hypothetical protein
MEEETNCQGCQDQAETFGLGGVQRLETMAQITIEDGITVSDAISILVLHLKKQKYKIELTKSARVQLTKYY